MKMILLLLLLLLLMAVMIIAVVIVMIIGMMISNNNNLNNDNKDNGNDSSDSSPLVTHFPAVPLRTHLLPAAPQRRRLAARRLPQRLLDPLQRLIRRLRTGPGDLEGEGPRTGTRSQIHLQGTGLRRLTLGGAWRTDGGRGGRGGRGDPTVGRRFLEDAFRTRRFSLQGGRGVAALDEGDEGGVGSDLERRPDLARREINSIQHDPEDEDSGQGVIAVAEALHLENATKTTEIITLFKRNEKS